MPKRENDIDALFQLPLGEFIGARKLLAAQLKKEGNAERADYVKALAKPSISAWTVNQLYWQHTDAFERLLASGQRFHKAQKSGKVADMREALAARRDALSQLSDSASALLRDGAHNPSIETMRRITTTLEGISAYASLSGSDSVDRPTPGRLTQDVDPPGFETVAGFVPSGPTKPLPAVKQVTAKPAAVKVPKTAGAVAKVQASLQGARKLLTTAQKETERLTTKKKKLEAAVKEADKRKRLAEQLSHDAEQRLKQASAAAQETEDDLSEVVDELATATESLKTHEEAVERMATELDKLKN